MSANFLAVLVVVVILGVLEVVGQGVNVHSLSTNMLRYSSVDVHLYNNLLPGNDTFTLQIL